ncbi:hypothetical protein ABUL04_06475 [Micromonospora harpali]|uniref:Uncharacterized protein n=1 Tax=Micromonospora harpali TaxID=1490225 RepID=A0ABW1HRZ7_9ACTN
MKAGDVLHLTRAASPQFVRPIYFRLIKVRTELHTYAGWTWLDGYQLDRKGEAVCRRELHVLQAAVRLLRPSPISPLASAATQHRGRLSAPGHRTGPEP